MALPVAQHGWLIRGGGLRIWVCTLLQMQDWRVVSNQLRCTPRKQGIWISLHYHGGTPRKQDLHQQSLGDLKVESAIGTTPNRIKGIYRRKGQKNKEESCSSFHPLATLLKFVS